jgi:Mrp family chromosome partitioning ATPase/capsular polysaccharide biosynthesis protein
MLQTPIRSNHSISRDTVPPDGLPAVSLADVADFIRRRLWIISLTCLVAWGIALLYLIAAVPTFTAEADLVIESKAPLADAASVSTIVESQIGIIKSESIARAVMQKLDLTVDPEFVGRIGIVGGMIRSLAQLLGWSKPEPESTVMRHALESFQRKLSAKRVGLTYIVAMSFESIDPERAAQILNTIPETYIARQMDAKYNLSLQDQVWIQNRLTELSSQASAAQKALEDYHKNRKDIADSVDAGAERALAAAAESSKGAYDNFRHVLRQNEAARQQSKPVFEASLVSKALPPLKASSPKRAIVLGLSTIAGVLLGIAFGALRDLSDQGIRAGAQVWNDLEVACIAIVPMVKPNGVRRRLKTFFTGPAQRLPTNWSAKSPVRNGLASQSPEGERSSKRALSNPTSTDPRSQNIVRMESPIWTITDAPQSPFTESLLEIKLAIDSMTRSGKRMQVIGITSTRPKEGKSTIAAALALLIAHTEARVVLLDCNFRNRSLSAGLAPAAASGILDVMTGAVSLPAITWTDPLSRLSFLPAGNSSRPIYAIDALRSETLDELFKALRKTYEYIIVDLPAVAPFADVRAAVHLLDSFIIVAECGRTNIGVVERALKVCSGINELMLGVALNKADTNLLKGFELGS